jgi:hypothetical protein
MPWYRHKLYGLVADQKLDKKSLEIFGFRVGGSIATGGISKYEHFKNYATDALPELEWNPWMERQFQSLCDDTYAYKDGETIIRSVNWTGCGSAGKTFSAGVYSVLWFRALPGKSAVTLVSSSKQMLKRRVWPIIQKTHYELSKGPYAFGHLVDSQIMLQAEKSDSKHAIAGTAIQGGELQSAIENLKGLHAERILVIIDEAPGTEEAICETIPNIRKACQDLTILTIGNAISHLDIHGRCCEPAAGWASISVESETWKTKGVKAWSLPSGRADHFDGFKSPNVIAGKTVHRYLYTYEDYRAAKANSQERQTIQLWSNDRGFWTPAGVLNTVFDEVMIEKYGSGELMWQSHSEQIASLDPAFGGDGCILHFADYGDLPSGRFGIQLRDFISIQGDPTSKDEIDYQIASRVVLECDKRRIRPEKFAMDKTGTGRGVYAILRQTWGEVLGVEFGGAASTKPASSADSRKSCDVYDRKVTELWYSCREFLLGEQLKGFYPEATIQACSREYTIKARKICLDTKDECKKKIGRSPDHFDAIAVLCELARTFGALAGIYIKASDRWEIAAREWDEIYESDDIATNEPIEEQEVNV